MKLVLCPAYLPNVLNFSWMIKQPKVYFNGGINYQKQSFRNRAEIYGANGKLKLTIPIKHSRGTVRKSYKNVIIDYDQIESTLLEKEILQKADHPFLVGMEYVF